MNSASHRGRYRSQAGSTAIEAAVVFPIFVGIVFLSINLILACHKMIQLQDAVAEVTRQAFTKTRTDRGNLSWNEYIKTNVYSRARNTIQVYEATKLTADEFWSQKASATYLPNSLPGSIYTLEVIVDEPIFPIGIGGISLASIPFKSKAIAVIQMKETQ